MSLPKPKNLSDVESYAIPMFHAAAVNYTQRQ